MGGDLMLTLFDELFLLAIDEERGLVPRSVAENLGIGLAGALLAELALQGKVQVGENRRLALMDDKATGDDFIDKALKEIASNDRPRKITYWVRTLGSRSKKLRRNLGQRLVKAGFLTWEDEYYLLVVPSPLDPQLSASTKYVIKERLRNIILACKEADLRSLALLNLARDSNLLKLIFTIDELKSAERGIHEQFVRVALENSVAQTLEEIGEGISASV